MMTETTRAHYMATLVPLAQRFVAAIHDDGPDVAWKILETVDEVPRPPDMEDADLALLTILAAMVDPTRSRDELLGWVQQPPHLQLARLTAASAA